MAIKQTTLAKAFQHTGIGLHSGQAVNMCLQPAPADTGVVFCRTDIAGQPCVSARADRVTQVNRATTLEEGAAKVFTVEHILSACYSLGLDNVRIEMNAPEPPVMDGSAEVIGRLIEQTGLQELEKPRRIFRPTTAVTVRGESQFVTLLPYEHLRISFTSVNPHPHIGVQYMDFTLTKDSYMREIAPARTIGFMDEVEHLKKQGLALGGTLENALVYDDKGMVNIPRFFDELVRHKILDVLGDISLAGALTGHIVAVSSSHALNTGLAKLLLAARQKEEGQ